MDRAAYILAVKARIEEISPFDEPAGFIAGTDTEGNADPDNSEVKPIVSYIDATLDKAAWYCLMDLPYRALVADVREYKVQDEDGEEVYPSAVVDGRGVGRLPLPATADWRPVSLRDMAGFWQRAIWAFLTPEDPLSALQHNVHTRGGCAKPVAVWSAATREVELYSFPLSCCGCGCGEKRLPIRLQYIDAHIKAEDIESKIDDFVVLVCAAYVEEILGDANAAKVFWDEYVNKKGVL